jgi:hypothetical protein
MATKEQLQQLADAMKKLQGVYDARKQQETQTIPVDMGDAPTPPMFEPKPPPDDLSLKAQVDKQRLLLEQTHQSQLETVNKQLEEAKKREAEYLKKQEGVMKEADPLTQPFREDIEKAERERLKVEENFFANQKITEELDRLLTESIEMTRKLQTQKVPGLAGLQQSGRMVKAQETAQGRIAVIEAVMAARSNQIGTALNFINRTTESIRADRQDRLSYLESLFNFYETTRTEAGAKVFNLTQDQKAIIQKQTKLIEDDLARAEKVSDMIREMMLSNPKMAAESGIGLGDTEEEIVKKIAQWEYTEETRTVKNNAMEKGMKEITANQVFNLSPDRVFTYTDSRGNEVYFEIPEDTGKWTTQKVDNNLYRVNTDTGKVELLIRGAAPAGGSGTITGDSSGLTVGGLNFSTETYSVLVGSQDINKLTPSKQQAVRADLTQKLQLHKAEVHSGFKPFIENAFNTTFTDQEIKSMWAELRKQLGVENQVVGDSVSSEDEDMKEAWTQAMVRGTAIQNQKMTFLQAVGKVFTSPISAIKSIFK